MNPWWWTLPVWANLTRADLYEAYGRDDWDALVERGALR